MTFNGNAYCHWTGGDNEGNKRYYEGNEAYLKERTYLVGGRDG